VSYVKVECAVMYSLLAASITRRRR